MLGDFLEPILGFCRESTNQSGAALRGPQGPPRGRLAAPEEGRGVIPHTAPAAVATEEGPNELPPGPYCDLVAAAARRHTGVTTTPVLTPAFSTAWAG